MLAHLGRRLAILGTMLGVWGCILLAGPNWVYVKVLIMKAAPRRDAEECCMFWEGGWEWARLTMVRSCRIHLAKPSLLLANALPLLDSPSLLFTQPRYSMSWSPLTLDSSWIVERMIASRLHEAII